MQFMLHKLFINSESIMGNITKGISLVIATLFVSRAYSEITLLNPDILGINDKIIIDNEYSDVGDNINDVSVNNTTNNTNDDILDVKMKFNTNLDDTDNDVPKNNNEDNDQTPIHLNISH
jgi:hypothetical protein